MSRDTLPKSVLQFSVRSFFIVVVVLSVGLAVFVPHVRAQPPAIGRILTWVGGLCSGLAVVFLLILCLSRRSIGNRGGNILLRPKRLKAWLHYLPGAIFPIVLVGVNLGAYAMFSPTWTGIYGALAAPIWTVFVIGTLLSVTAPVAMGLMYSVTLFWWRVNPMTLEIRESGVIIGGLKFLPWNTITDCHWLDGKHATILTLWGHSRKSVAMMPFESRESAQRLLETKGVEPQRNRATPSVGATQEVSDYS
jgi:hypothetical protein